MEFLGFALFYDFMTGETRHSMEKIKSSQNYPQTSPDVIPVCIQSNFNGSNTFETMKRWSSQVVRANEC